MSAAIISLIRTWVPVAVGSLVAWLISIGIELDPEAETGLVVGLTGVVIAAYYGIVRWLERRWPWIGVLLGVPAAPSYDRRTETERLADELADADRRAIVAALDTEPVRPDPDGVVRWHE
jgi:hypothetical protein